AVRPEGGGTVLSYGRGLLESTDGGGGWEEGARGGERGRGRPFGMNWPDCGGGGWDMRASVFVSSEEGSGQARGRGRFPSGDDTRCRCHATGGRSARRRPVDTRIPVHTGWGGGAAGGPAPIRG